MFGRRHRQRMTRPSAPAAPAAAPAPAATAAANVAAGTSVTGWYCYGGILAIWHPYGAPGGSTVAAALAGALGPVGRVLLLDADCLRGAQAARLAADRGYGNVASAAALVRAGGPPCPDGHLQPLERAGCDLLAGVPGPARPVAVDAGGLRRLLGGLRTLYDLVIVDVGWSLPPHAGGEAHQAALQEADRILIVAAPSPLGLDDLSAQYPILVEKLGLAVARPRPWLVLNGGGGEAQGRIESRLQRELDLVVGAYIPHDRPAVAAAEAHHLPLTVDRPRSPAARVLHGIAHSLWYLPGFGAPPAAPAAAEAPTAPIAAGAGQP